MKLPASRISSVVTDIMATPLVTGNASARFADLSVHPIWGQIDQIPVEDSGVIVGICDRPSNPESKLGECMAPIRSDMLVSSQTPILSLFEADWARHPFFLVVEETRIVGIVTPSDLNKLPVYAAIFDLIALMENLLTKLLDRRPTDVDRLSILKGSGLELTEPDYVRLVDGGFAISRVQVLYLKDKLALYASEHDGKLREDTIKAVNRLRNKVFHQNPLVNSTAHIAQLHKTLVDVAQLIADLSEAEGA